MRPRPRDCAKRTGFSCGYIDAQSFGEVKVVTASAPRFIRHGIVPRPKSLLSGPDGKPPTWSARLQALRYVPPLLKLVYQTHRGYTVAILALRALRSFIPLAVLWIGKLIIDGVIAAMQGRAAGAGVDRWALGSLVALELGIAVAGEGLARLAAVCEGPLAHPFP